MSFEFLDDFQDTIKGGIHGLVNTIFANPHVQDEGLNPVATTARVQKFPSFPVKFKKQNHVLEWMVKENTYYSNNVMKYFIIHMYRSSMNKLDCFNIQLLVN